MQKLALAVSCSQVVFEALKSSDLLRVKNAKINLAKFHMSTVCGREQLNKFSSLAFLLGIAANALGYKGGGVSKPCAGTASSSTGVSKADKAASSTDASGSTAAKLDDPVEDLACSMPVTLRQADAQQSMKPDVLWNPQNQLHRAAVEFNDYSNYYKQSQIARVLTPLQKLHSSSSSRLRSLDDTIPWEP